MPSKQNLCYEGKAKILYTTDDPTVLIQYFKDDATAFNAQKKGTIVNKGVLNNQISSRIFELLAAAHIPTHYLGHLSEREMLVKRVEIIPVEFVFRNRVAGSLAKRLGLEEGTPLARPVFELYYKDDALGDPFINDDHVLVFGWASAAELTRMRELGEAVNTYLRRFFEARGIVLVDGKLEFGRDATGTVILADEITPDGLRLWDAKTHEKLDKDRFRRDLGHIEEAYHRIFNLVCGDSTL